MGPLLALLQREFFERVRTTEHFVMRTSYALLMFLFLVFLGEDIFLRGLNEPISISQTRGQTIFGVFTAVQFTLILLMVPLLGAGAVVSERVERSLQLLFLTNLTYSKVILGKFLSRFLLVFVLVMSNVPMLFLAGLLGGVEPLDVLRVLSLTMATCGMLLGVSILASTLVVRSAARAAIWCYVFLITLLLSLFALDGVDVVYMVWWHPVLAMTMTMTDPLAFPDAWWMASVFNFGAAALAVLAAMVSLKGGARRPPVFEDKADLKGEEGARRVWKNPVAWREWAGKGRVWRWGIFSLVLGGVLATGIIFSGDSSLYLVGFNILLFTAALFVIAVTSSVFAEEKREQTLDLLKLTYLSPWQIVLGKMASLWRVCLCFVLVILPPTIAFSFVEHNFPFLAVPVPIIAFTLGLTFLGSIGVFYSLVAETPMRAIFPTVASFIYLSTPLFAWPMLILDSDDFLSLGVVIGWGVALMPPLMFVLRYAPSKVLRGAGLLVVWALVLLPASDAAPLVVSLFAYVNVSFLGVVEGDGLWAEIAWGSFSMLVLSCYFLWCAKTLLDREVTSDENEADNPVLAAMLSGFLPGAGQIYLGHGARGGVIMVCAFVTFCIGFSNIAAAVDAYKLGKKKQALMRQRVVQRRRDRDVDGAASARP